MDRRVLAAGLLCPLLFAFGWFGGSSAGRGVAPGGGPAPSCSPASVSVVPRAKDPWAPLAPSAKLPEPLQVWDVLSSPDQLVGKPVSITGYVVIGFEFAQLAQTEEEVRVFDRWRAERPRAHPRMRLLGLDLARVDLSGQPRASLHGRRVSVTGAVKQAVDPSEPDPVLRWAHGVGFDANALRLLP